MESQMFDNVKFEKEKAIARFNRLRRVVKLWQIVEVVVVFGLISWCSARAPAVLKVIGGYALEFSTYLLNHHVVFFIGNAIIVFLITLCRENDVGLSVGRDLYDDYVKYSEAAVHRRDCFPTPHPDAEEAVAADSGGGDCENKQIVVRAEETKPISQCDDLAAAIEEATRQIRKFQRTQSEVLKREITARRRPELRRSETESSRKAESSDASEMETLSNEEFQRRVDAFIDKHWIRRTTKANQLDEFGNHNQLRLGKIA